jgi:hypothetical protein
LERRHAFGDFRKEIGGVEFEIVFVDGDHLVLRSKKGSLSA